MYGCLLIHSRKCSSACSFRLSSSRSSSFAFTRNLSDNILIGRKKDRKLWNTKTSQEGNAKASSKASSLKFLCPKCKQIYAKAFSYSNWHHVFWGFFYHHDKCGRRLHYKVSDDHLVQIRIFLLSKIIPEKFDSWLNIELDLTFDFRNNKVIKVTNYAINIFSLLLWTWTGFFYRDKLYFIRLRATQLDSSSDDRRLIFKITRHRCWQYENISSSREARWYGNRNWFSWRFQTASVGLETNAGEEA